MGRGPCCDKVGLKKGPWSRDEDQILISYIQQHGHPNWRALPKLSGLLRCGKSCRLRWNNYLRPDIKRGNFSKEEEDTIINLHQELGNRWSVIATKLPGRTDNEIKNVWHTHLKKKLENYQMTTHVSRRECMKSERTWNTLYSEDSVVSQFVIQLKRNPRNKEQFISSKPSSSESSSITEATTDPCGIVKLEDIDQETFLDDSFWSETLSGEGSSMVESNLSSELGPEFSIPLFTSTENNDTRNPDVSYDTDGMDLWNEIFMRVEELPELPEF